MTHFQDEGHYQEHMNAQAQAEMEAQMHQMEGEAEAELQQVEDCKAEPQSEYPFSFGEMLVGIEFNPSNDDKVAKAKMLCAELSNLLHDHYESNESSFLKTKLYQHAIGEILNAQMNVVKVLTFKY